MSALDLEVLRKGAPKIKFSVEADPEDVAYLQSLLRHRLSANK